MTVRSSCAWPELPYERCRDTYATLQLWMQIAGKVRLVQSPWLNHSWHVPLYLTARGLSTSPIPHGARHFELSFDFVDHALVIATSDGATRRIALAPRTVADFHAAVMDALDELGLPVRIHDTPNEVPDAIPFGEDTVHAAYDADCARALWRALLQMHRVFARFRTGFLGKCSPVHFFWGSFDLAVTRFSGRRAPLHRGGVPNLPDAVAREAYSHEVSSAGFWPGGSGIDHAAFLQLRLSRAGRLPERRGKSCRGGFQRDARGVPAALRRRPQCRRPRRDVVRVPADDLRGGRERGALGPRRARVSRWRSGHSARRRLGARVARTARATRRNVAAGGRPSRRGHDADAGNCPPLHRLVATETDLMVDSVNAMAALLGSRTTIRA